MKEAQRGWLQAALYLSLAAFLAKGLSALYKIPYQNMTGDSGFYVYQQVYPIYGIVLVLGTYGFPLVIAKAVLQIKDPELLRRQLTFYLWSLFLCFALLGSGVIFFASSIAQLMGDEALTPAVRWMGAPFFLIPFFAVARGYFQGRHTTVPTAVTQVTEQFVRVIVILLVAWIAMQTADVYQAGTSAGIGALAGGGAGLVVMWLYIKKHPLWWRPDFRLPDNVPQLTGSLLKQGIFVSASAMVLVLFQIVDAFTIVQRLPEGQNAGALKGVYDRSWPLIQFGAIVTTVFSYAALPAVTKAWQNDQHAAAAHASKALKICVVFGGAAAFGMLLTMPVLNTAMFTDGSGTGVLQVMAFVVLSGSAFMTAAALLHAVDKAGAAAAVLLGGVIIKAVLNVTLIPALGIMGAALSSAAASLLLALAAFLYLHKIGCFLPFSKLFWGKWLTALLIMGGGVLLLLQAGAFLPEERSIAFLLAGTVSVAGAVLFLFIIWRLSLFTKTEWQEIPKISTWMPHRDTTY